MIAISQQTLYIDNYKESRDMLDIRWYNVIKKINILPVIIPNSLCLVQKICNQYKLEGILLTGGKDSDERELVENYLIQHAINNNLPILGICHGMQVIQRFFGIKLENVYNHVCTHQEIFLHNKIIYRNSYHNLGTKNTNDELIVWARSADQTVKGIYHRSLPIVGIMWHPERENILDDFDIKILKDTLQKQLISNDL